MLNKLSQFLFGCKDETEFRIIVDKQVNFLIQRKYKDGDWVDIGSTRIRSVANYLLKEAIKLHKESNALKSSRQYLEVKSKGFSIIKHVRF